MLIFLLKLQPQIAVSAPALLSSSPGFVRPSRSVTSGSNFLCPKIMPFVLQKFQLSISLHLFVKCSITIVMLMQCNLQGLGLH